jgi:hypothetical protein
MSMSINRNAASLPLPRAKPANFGQLNAAIARGDLAAAAANLTALEQSTARSAIAVKTRGDLDATKSAVAAGDPQAARSALADFRKDRVRSNDALPPEVTAPIIVPPPVTEVLSLITGSEPLSLG